MKFFSNSFDSYLIFSKTCELLRGALVNYVMNIHLNSMKDMITPLGRLVNHLGAESSKVKRNNNRVCFRCQGGKLWTQRFLYDPWDQLYLGKL